MNDVRCTIECPVCACPIEGQAMICPRCDTPHHQDCWDYTGGCAIFGCAASQTRTADRVQGARGLPTSYERLERGVDAWLQLYRGQMRKLAYFGNAVALGTMVWSTGLLLGFHSGSSRWVSSSRFGSMPTWKPWVVIETTVAVVVAVVAIYAALSYLTTILRSASVRRELERDCAVSMQPPPRGARELLDAVHDSREASGLELGLRWAQYGMTAVFLLTVLMAAAMEVLPGLGVTVQAAWLDWGLIAGVSITLFMVRYVILAPLSTLAAEREAYSKTLQNRLQASLKRQKV